MKVRLPREVRSDPIPGVPGTIAPPGVYEATVHAAGAVTIEIPDGGQLGVKPGEFERVPGPNATRLIAMRMAALAVPVGGGVADAVRAITTPGRLQAYARQATEELANAIAAIKAAPDNPWGNDDEVIAGHLLRMANDRRAAKQRGGQ